MQKRREQMLGMRVHSVLIMASLEELVAFLACPLMKRTDSYSGVMSLFHGQS